MGLLQVESNNPLHFYIHSDTSVNFKIGLHRLFILSPQKKDVTYQGKMGQLFHSFLSVGYWYLILCFVFSKAPFARLDSQPGSWPFPSLFFGNYANSGGCWEEARVLRGSKRTVKCFTLNQTYKSILTVG